MRRIIALMGVVLFSALVSSPSAYAQGDPTGTGDGTVKVDSKTFEQLLEMIVLEQGVETIKRNIEASKRETNDIDKAVRAVLGVSIRDIRKYGLLGGPNSEMRKLFKALGLADSVKE